MIVLSWKGPCSLFGRLIRLKTGSAYSHTELLFSDGKRFRIDGGIKAQFYWPNDAPKWNPELWDAIEVTGGDEDAARNWCLGEVGTSYDWLGIVFCQIFPWGRSAKNKWFCSELATAALQAGGYPQAAGLKPHYQSPPKLADALIFRGAKFILP